MLRLNLAREPYWLDLGLDVRVRVEPLTTALMVAARSDPAVRGLPVGTSDDEIAVIFGKALGCASCNKIVCGPCGNTKRQLTLRDATWDLVDHGIVGSHIDADRVNV